MCVSLPFMRESTGLLWWWTAYQPIGRQLRNIVRCSEIQVNVMNIFQRSCRTNGRCLGSPTSGNEWFAWWSVIAQTHGNVDFHHTGSSIAMVWTTNGIDKDISGGNTSSILNTIVPIIELRTSISSIGWISIIAWLSVPFVPIDIDWIDTRGFVITLAARSTVVRWIDKFRYSGIFRLKIISRIRCIC